MGILNKKSTNTLMEETIIEVFWGSSPKFLDKTIIEKESIHFYLKNQNPLPISGTHFNSTLNNDFPYNQFHIHGSNEQGLTIHFEKTTPNIRLYNHTNNEVIYNMVPICKLKGDLVFDNVFLSLYPNISLSHNNAPHCLGEVLKEVTSFDFGETGGILMHNYINKEWNNIDQRVYDNYMNLYHLFQEYINLPYINLVVVDEYHDYSLIIHMDLLNRLKSYYKRYGRTQ